METVFAVMNTDQVNRQGTRFPGRVLAESIETLVESCVRRGLPVGAPSYKAHDRHRLNGWAVGTELFVAGDMTRHVGEILFSETDHDRAQLEALCARYWQAYEAESVAPFREELDGRLSNVSLEGARYVMTEAASVIRPGLAAELYPEFLASGGAHVDKDGLVDVKAFLGSVTEVHSGVFHDRERDLLLFAHPSLRRSLSRRNALNAYFLDIFRETASGPALRARLRLDPDMIGLPASARRPIELEYWRGPRFDPDISAIPTGVSEHKAAAIHRDLEGIDKTQIWWKDPETRTTTAGQTETYRTLECEELVENPSAGLGDDVFGCRYAHAEFDAGADVISHFDGAIRAYGADAYLDRIDLSIDRAGKHAQYTKLFRLDGALPIDAWKRLLTGFYRGNPLIPEYLGEPPEPDLLEEVKVEDAAASSAPSPVAPALSALLSYHLPRQDQGVAIISQDHIAVGSVPYDVVEVGGGAVAEFIQATCDLDGMTTVAPSDDILSLSPLTIGADRLGDWKDLLTGLADAIAADQASGRLSHIACSLLWDNPACGLRLSLCGEARLVASLLCEAGATIDPAAASATWFEPFDEALKSLAPKEVLKLNWAAIRPKAGRLQWPRTGVYEAAFMIPEDRLDSATRDAMAASTP